MRKSPRRQCNLYERVIYRCVIGSRAYGLDDAESDTDRRGIYLPPADLHWSLYGVPEQLENDETQEVYWEIQKFLVLALKANPNVLECLFTPLVEMATPLGRRIARNANRLSLPHGVPDVQRLRDVAVQADAGPLRNQGNVKWKHVMHLIRLLISGTRVLREGFVPVRVEEHRDALLAIKRRRDAVGRREPLAACLHEDFNKAFEHTSLPERPDYEKANRFLIKVRRWREGLGAMMHDVQWADDFLTLACNSRLTAIRTHCCSPRSAGHTCRLSVARFRLRSAGRPCAAAAGSRRPEDRPGDRSRSPASTTAWRSTW